ncbi:MAG: hypothetical protein ACLT3R_00690 [Roseburia sp.]
MEQIEMETEKEQIEKTTIAEACRRTRYCGWRASENERGTSIGASRADERIPKKWKKRREPDLAESEAICETKFRLRIQRRSEKKEPKHRFLARSIRIRGKEYQQTVYECIQSGSAMYRYDQEQHKWTDMTEWAFLGYQERKKALLKKIMTRRFIWIKQQLAKKG